MNTSILLPILNGIHNNIHHEGPIIGLKPLRNLSTFGATPTNQRMEIPLQTHSLKNEKTKLTVRVQ